MKNFTFLLCLLCSFSLFSQVDLSAGARDVPESPTDSNAPVTNQGDSESSIERQEEPAAIKNPFNTGPYRGEEFIFPKTEDSEEGADL